MFLYRTKIVLSNSLVNHLLRWRLWLKLNGIFLIELFTNLRAMKFIDDFKSTQTSSIIVILLKYDIISVDFDNLFQFQILIKILLYSFILK